MLPLVLYLGEHQLCDKTGLEKVIHRQHFRLLMLSHESHWERWYKSQRGLDKRSCATCMCHKKESCAHIPAHRKPTWHPQAHLLPVHTYSSNQTKSSKCLYCRLGATSPRFLGPISGIWWEGTLSSKKLSSWEVPQGQKETNHHQFVEPP